MDNDELLVERARRAPSGDTRAFDQLVLRHQERVLANCRYLSGSPDDAQDLAQGVFVKAYFALPKFEGRSAFSTWIQRIKINHCLNFLRSRKKRAYVDIHDPVTEAQEELRVESRAEQRVLARNERERIQAILDELPDTLRVPLIMRDLDGMAYQDIADDLEIGLSAVKMRIKRAREEFRARYEAMLADHPEFAGTAATRAQGAEP